VWYGRSSSYSSLTEPDVAGCRHKSYGNGMQPAPLLAGKPQQFLSIQYLRAFAALGVVAYHASPAEHPFTIGNAGVDIFFVISGFIMWSITEERPASPLSFLKSRLIRIVPVYWLITALLLGGALAFPKLFPSLKIDIPYAIGSFLFVPMRPPGSAENGPIWPILVQGWTLNYEMFFYFLFCICLLLKPLPRLAALSFALLCCVISGLFYNGNNAIVHSFTDPILIEFMAGVLLGVCVRRDFLPSRPWGYWLAGFGVILLLALAITSVTQPRLFAWGIPAVLVVVGAVVLDTKGRIPQLRLLKLIGDSSYSIYLSHGLALSALGKIMPRSDVFSFVGIVAAIGVGIAFWYLVERPLTEILKRWFVNRETNRFAPQARFDLNQERA
jgi:exopolysaccharide production protein ExoZ